MADNPSDIAQYQSDHDILIELRTEFRALRETIKDSTFGTQRMLDDHEKRIRALEDARTADAGRSGAFSWIGSAVYASIAIIAGLIGSIIQSGKFW